MELYEMVLVACASAVVLLLGVVFIYPQILITVMVHLMVIFSPFKQKKVRLDEHLYCSYLERGTIATTTDSVLLLHGFSGSAVDFLPLKKMFDSSYHVIAMDLLNHGYSTRQSRNVTLDDMLDFIEKFVEAVGLHTRKFHLLGFSIGAFISINYASVRKRQQIASLCLLAPPGVVMNHPPGLNETTGSLRINSNDEMKQFLHFSSSGHMSIPPTIFLTALRNYKNDDCIYKEHVMKGFKNNLYFTDEIMKNIADLPTVLLWGENDLVVPMRPALHYFSNHHPEVRVHVLEKCGHLMMLTRPDEVISHMLPWFRKHAIGMQRCALDD